MGNNLGRIAASLGSSQDMNESYDDIFDDVRHLYESSEDDQFCLGRGKVFNASPEDQVCHMINLMLGNFNNDSTLNEQGGNAEYHTFQKETKLVQETEVNKNRGNQLPPVMIVGHSNMHKHVFNSLLKSTNAQTDCM